MVKWVYVHLDLGEVVSFKPDGWQVFGGTVGLR